MMRVKSAHLRDQDVARGRGPAQEHPDDVGLAAEHGEDAGEAGEPVAAGQVQAEREQHHGRGHLVRVVEVAVEVEHRAQRHVHTAPHTQHLTVTLLEVRQIAVTVVYKEFHKLEYF